MLSSLISSNSPSYGLFGDIIRFEGALINFQFLYIPNYWKKIMKELNFFSNFEAQITYLFTLKLMTYAKQRCGMKIPKHLIVGLYLDYLQVINSYRDCIYLLSAVIINEKYIYVDEKYNILNYIMAVRTG